MSEAAPPAARRERLRRIGRRLAALPDPLEVIAEGWRGLEARIDLLARDGRGQVVLVLVAEAGEDPARLTDALAQRAWAEPRLADWAQLAPERGLRPDLGLRVLLLAPRFDPRTLAAAGCLAPGCVELATYRCVGEREDADVLLDAAEAGRAGAAVAADDPAPRSRFRTGLRDTREPSLVRGDPPSSPARSGPTEAPLRPLG